MSEYFDLGMSSGYNIGDILKVEHEYLNRLNQTRLPPYTVEYLITDIDETGRHFVRRLEDAN